MLTLTRARAACLLMLLFGLNSSKAAQPLSEGLSGDDDSTMWIQMMNSLNITVDNPNTTYGTMFAPTDRAVTAFLDRMGLTFDQLLARPVLVDIILAYHFVPGDSVKDFYGNSLANATQQLISIDPEEPTYMTTGDVNYMISAHLSPFTAFVVLHDAQGNRAVVVGDGRTLGNIVFYDISAVLMSGGYFYNAADALKHYPVWSTAAELIAKAALYSEGLTNKFIGTSESTFLMPSNDALKQVARDLARAPAEDLIDLIEYHVLLGLRPVASGWVTDAPVNTLLGRKITPKLGKTVYVDPFTGEGQQAPTLTLFGEKGKPVQVNIMNIFAGKSILQGLNGALLPDTAIIKAVSSGWRRHLLQGSTNSAQRQSKANTWSSANTRSAIRAAASGNVPVSYATAAGSRNAAAAAGGCINCLRWGI